MQNVSKIAIPTRPQPDTIVAIFILKTFGKDLFPGIDKAVLEVASKIPETETFASMLKKGTLLLDIGGGDLDHHGKNPPVTCAELVCSLFGISDKPALSKLLDYVRRDDMSGKGTVSADALDRAFGLSGLVTALNKIHADDAPHVVSTVLPLIEAHYLEEVKRTEELPREFKEAVEAKKVDTFEVRQRDKKLKVVIIETENMSMLGYLRSQLGGAFDVVVRRSASGHVNILTRPTKRVDLRSLALVIRLEEGNKRGAMVKDDPRHLSSAGKLPEVPNWYYDTATNSILNGGSSPKDAEPTVIDAFTMRKLIQVGLSEQLWSPASTFRR